MANDRIDYINEIIELVNKCNDVPLLNFILQLLQKSQEA
jgi:hypothetical protein